MSRSSSIVRSPQIPSNRLPHLDGLRSLSLMGVLLYHFHVRLFSASFIGFNIFFNFSGYLITRNLLHTTILHHTILSLTSFHKRHFFRLFPFSCFTVFVTMALFITTDKASSIFKSAVTALTLWSNVYLHHELFFISPLKCVLCFTSSLCTWRSSSILSGRLCFSQ